MHKPAIIFELRARALMNGILGILKFVNTATRRDVVRVPENVKVFPLLERARARTHTRTEWLDAIIVFARYSRVSDPYFEYRFSVSRHAPLDCEPIYMQNYLAR